MNTLKRVRFFIVIINTIMPEIWSLTKNNYVYRHFSGANDLKACEIISYETQKAHKKYTQRLKAVNAASKRKRNTEGKFT